jgi:type II secretory pathway component PulM
VSIVTRQVVLCRISTHLASRICRRTSCLQLWRYSKFWLGKVPRERETLFIIGWRSLLTLLQHIGYWKTFSSNTQTFFHDLKILTSSTTP